MVTVPLIYVLPLWDFEKENAKREWLMAAVLAGDVSTRLGNQQTRKYNLEITRESSDDANWSIAKECLTNNNVSN